MTNPDAFQQMLAQLRNNFLDEMPEKLNTLEQLLLNMESQGVSSDQFNEFYRVIHSLKGSGGTFGLHIITTICHQLEDLLNATEGGARYTAPMISISLNYVDLLRQTLEQILAKSVSFSNIEESLTTLRKILAPKKHNILVVDDSKLYTQIYTQALTDIPVHIVNVTDGYLALLRALSEPFDLIITTNEVPVLNGIALISAIKLSGYRNHLTPTILVSSNLKLIQKHHRNTDPDFFIYKNADLMANVNKFARQALEAKSDA